MSWKSFGNQRPVLGPADMAEPCARHAESTCCSDSAPPSTPQSDDEGRVTTSASVAQNDGIVVASSLTPGVERSPSTTRTVLKACGMPPPPGLEQPVHAPVIIPTSPPGVWSSLTKLRSNGHAVLLEIHETKPRRQGHGTRGMHGKQPHYSLDNNRDDAKSALSSGMQQQARGDSGRVLAEDRHTALLQLIDSWKDCPTPAEADSLPSKAASPSTVAKDQQMQAMKRSFRNLPIDTSHLSSPECSQTTAHRRHSDQLLSANLLHEYSCTKQPQPGMAKHIPDPFSYKVDEYPPRTMSFPEPPICFNPVLLGRVFSF